MSTADATRDDAPPSEKRAMPTRSRVPPTSPALSAAWLLRTAAFAAVASGAMGVIIAPGVRGNANGRVVDWMEGGSATLGYFLLGLLVALALWGALELVRAQVGTLVRMALVGGGAAVVALIAGGSAVVALSASGLRDRLPPPLALLIAAAAAITALAGAAASARAPHTRALAGILFAFAFAAIARLGAWELATAASDRASVQLYGVSRGFATAGAMFEAVGQLVTVTWLGTRSKVAGQLGSSAALVAAFALTWGVARGVHSGAALWQAILHTALADAPGVPPPYALDALATFLVPASLLLALVAAAQPRQVAAVVATTALALVSRGAFDAPLRALCVVVAAQWAVLACSDERAMWRALIDERKQRLADEGRVSESTRLPEG